MAKEMHEFQAETKQLLDLMIHSIYTNHEIFLRELISNASDAIDKLHFEALTNRDLLEGNEDYEIFIVPDKESHTLTISDNGIGMNREEVVENIGTIAKSGTKAFLEQLKKAKESNEAISDKEMIGQFGVGFYSGFIVADKITVESRRAGLPPEQGVRWISGGAGDFKTETITRTQRGTSITLHLRDDKHDYLNGYKLKGIIGQYSDHISLPILMPKEEWKEGENGQPGEMVQTGEWEQVNEASALWTRPKKDITPEQYNQFYQTLAHDFTDPLAWSHNKVEGNTEYTQLLYVPSKAPFDLYQRDHKHGLKLYIRRVFVMDEAEALLPQYLRFVKGVIDASDLPLNVSRELLQESRDVKTIREGNTRRVLAMIEDMAKAASANNDTTAAPSGNEAGKAAETDAFSRFYAEFGSVLKEGLGEDPSNRERIAKLLRFASTTTDSASVSLSSYKARMKEGQEAIYYITADTLAAARNSPQLEIFRKKGIEVLFMADRVDEWALSFLHEFDGTPLQSVAKGAVDLGKLQNEEEKQAVEAAQEDAKPLLETLKEVLKGKAEDVRATTRLVDSAACLVSQEHGMSTQLARLLKQAGQPVPDVKPVLEINLQHPLIARLRVAQNDETRFADLAHIVFDQALLAEGGLPDDPAAYVRRVNALLA